MAFCLKPLYSTLFTCYLLTKPLMAQQCAVLMWNFNEIWIKNKYRLPRKCVWKHPLSLKAMLVQSVLCWASVTNNSLSVYWVNTTLLCYSCEWAQVNGINNISHIVLLFFVSLWFYHWFWAESCSLFTIFSRISSLALGQLCQCHLSYAAEGYGYSWSLINEMQRTTKRAQTFCIILRI